MSGFSLNFPGHPHAALQPRLMRFGLLPLRSPLLGESLLISVPELLDGSLHSVSPPYPILFRYPDDALTRAGLLHSVIRGSKDMCSSPRLFAAYHDLPRLTAP